MMKTKYDLAIGVAYTQLRDLPEREKVAKTVPFGANHELMIDLDADDNVLGIEFMAVTEKPTLEPYNS